MKTNSLAAFIRSALALVRTASISTAASAASLPMLHASGTSIVDSSNKPVLLQGVNLGSWLLMEPWMCPMDSSGLPDNYGAISELDTRFGVATKQSLISTYQSS